MTISTCSMSNNTATSDGGAVYIEAGSTFIQYSNLTYNSAAGVGGAVRAAHSGDLWCTNNSITHNNARQGGAIAFNKITQCTSVNCGSNGAAYINSEFLENYADEGGAFYVASLDNTWAAITGAVLIDNADASSPRGSLAASVACAPAASAFCNSTCPYSAGGPCNTRCTDAGSCVYSTGNPNATSCLLGKSWRDCAGHGHCVVAADHDGSSCVCDPGYEPDSCEPTPVAVSSSSGGDHSHGGSKSSGSDDGFNPWLVLGAVLAAVLAALVVAIVALFVCCNHKRSVDAEPLLPQ
eukprot:TRINITY_DN614_c0_g1_i1.p1 TRINITY_DN614_c0_g1~~TRINITY_DN614_c0_g1_i1.p1  ORF type:complete len:295 (-),score=49.33 TRINITY_DN614_c0_g1_i1:138-1022(-)